MRFHKTFTTLALAGSTLLLSSGAFATEGASFVTCSRLATQVRSALEANSGSPNYQAAKTNQGYGATACATNAYDRGVSFYQKALDLLAQK
jgi:hypothetical protein